MDDTAPTTSGRRTSIRNKLLVGLAVPVLFVALISGFQVSKAQNNLNQTESEVTLAKTAGGQSTYITALLDERNISALTILGLEKVVKLDRVANMQQAREITNKTQDAFDRALQRGGPRVQALYQKTFDKARGDLVALRKDVDAVPADQRDPQHMEANEHLYDDFTKLIEGFHIANTDADARIDDAVLRNRAESIAAQTRSSDLLSLMSRTGAMSFLAPPEDESARTERSTKMARYKAQFDLARAAAERNVADDKAAFADVRGFYTRPKMKTFYGQVETFIRGGSVDDVTAMIGNAADTKFPNGTDAWKAATKSLEQRGDTLVSAAQSSRNRYVALFSLATLISLGLALLIARSIAKPLMSIAEQAEDMATRRLPEAVGSILATPIGQDVVQPELAPITVSSTDEVADVAASINVVQQRALDLAVEQAAQRRNFADTFLNLGRRVQGLVARQLDFITELEDAEDDPDVLADLFKLDHLATRIRRNAESLVVLAGVTRKQRRGQPVPVIDALRSALSEVDEYTRVDIRDVDEAMLPLSVAADLAHILAELIENGLNFSPPDTDVEVTGRLTEQGYSITVTDHGIGMDTEQIATANRRLSGNESFTVAPSRYMGHFVAGHLATALGIGVNMTSQGKGTQAIVVVPADLLASHTFERIEPDLDEGSAETIDPGQGGTVVEPDEPSDSNETSTATVDVESDTDSPVVDGEDDADTLSPSPSRRVSTIRNQTFRPAAPPPAPSPSAEGTPTGQAESLKSLLNVHRRLSRSDEPAEPDRSPWAKGENDPDS